MSYVMDPVRLGMADKVYSRDRYIAAALAEPKDSIDVMIMGDSEALTLADTSKLEEAGINAYITGQYGQRTGEAYYAFTSLLKNQSPKILILETNMVTLEMGTAQEAYLSLTAGFGNLLPVFKYHDMWKTELGLEHRELSEHYRGFEIREDEQPYTGGEYMFETADKLPMRISASFYLDKIKELCDKKGISLILVTAPSPVNHTYEKHNTIASYAAEKGLPYIDMNLMISELGIDWETDTLDEGDHVNYKGSSKITDYLIKYLKENYGLGD